MLFSCRSLRTDHVCGAYHNHGKAIYKPNLIAADWLEEAVYERLEKTLQSEDILQKITNQLNALIHRNHQEHETEVEILEDKLVDLEARKKKIQEEFEKGSGLYTESEAYERMAEVRKSIQEFKNALLPFNTVIILSNYDKKKNRNG